MAHYEDIGTNITESAAGPSLVIWSGAAASVAYGAGIVGGGNAIAPDPPLQSQYIYSGASGTEGHGPQTLLFKLRFEPSADRLPAGTVVPVTTVTWG